jgi:hypothetical protein
MTAVSINHVSVHAQDVETSAAFYEQLFGMERIPAPTFAFPVAWLHLGRQQLHLFVRSGARTRDARIREELIPLSSTVH